MRFRWTIILIIANILMFLLIWRLERDSSIEDSKNSEYIDFTNLIIEGKSISKPRVLKLENNKWRIISPIEWPANYFAVSRIKNQLEFLDKEASFLVSEVEQHGQTLSDYGLDSPSFTFTYGDGKNMRVLKVGRKAPLGNKIYMLDENSKKIIVVDQEFVENLAMDIDSLRGQNVFEIPRFEVNAFSIRMTQRDKNQLKTTMHRIGLVKDGDAWKFETPLVASADSNEVEAFLDALCSLSIKSFDSTNLNDKGLDVSNFPNSISLSGTNRKQTLLIGNEIDGNVYAKLDDNNTILQLDAKIFQNLNELQTTLRDKSFLKFSDLDLSSIEISNGSSNIKLNKLNSGLWEVSAKNQNGESQTCQGDYAIISNLINKLKHVRAIEFVNDAPGDDVKKYGMEKPVLKITINQANGESQTILLGDEYSKGIVKLRYATLANAAPIYGITQELMKACPLSMIDYKSRLYSSLPESAIVKKVILSNIKDGKVLLEKSFSNIEEWQNFQKSVSNKKDVAIALIVESVYKFIVSQYINIPFNKENIVVDGKQYSWAYKLVANIELRGTGESVMHPFTVYFSDRVGGNTQFGGCDNGDKSSTFKLSRSMIESLNELTIEQSAPDSLQTPDPTPKK